MAGAKIQEARLAFEALARKLFCRKREMGRSMRRYDDLSKKYPAVFCCCCFFIFFMIVYNWDEFFHFALMTRNPFSYVLLGLELWKVFLPDFTYTFQNYRQSFLHPRPRRCSFCLTRVRPIPAFWKQCMSNVILLYYSIIVLFIGSNTHIKI